MNKIATLTALLLMISTITSLLLLKAFKDTRPVGQKGIAGTHLSNSKKLAVIQIALLMTLDMACIVAILFLWI
ncbi:hypothetical protein [Rhodoferax antarcticus]|uniref:hypothetical protein n=1 Tax=Rhodoferax antarcticus TaxID=81479 RepID=UPI000B0CE57E|nr:hypothetical protein [Rhodoferax antarcticus]